MDVIVTPAKLGGRPKNAWNSSRRRKLVRLYSLTSLNKDEIRSVLKAHDFDPSSSDIQKKLKELFPRDYAKEYRTFRPLNRQQMNTRLCSVRHKPRTGAISVNRIRVRNASQPCHFEVFEGPGTAFRTFPDLELESISPDKLSLSNIQPCVPLNIPNSPGTARKSMTPWELYKCNLGSGAEFVNPSRLLLDGSTVVQKSAVAPSGPEDATFAIGIGSNTPQDGKKRAGLSLRSSGASFRSLQKRLARQSQSLVRHVDGVLRISLTNSWRSSLSWPSSWLARLSSADDDLQDNDREPLPDDVSLFSSNLQHAQPHLKPECETPNDEERRKLNKLIREAEKAWRKADARENTLYRESPRDVDEKYNYKNGPCTRDCCVTSIDSKGRCFVCASTPLHRSILATANSAKDFPPEKISSDHLNDPDNLGNTPLHYAAVARCSDPCSLIQLLALGMSSSSRNVFGQTFLHVLFGHVPCTKLSELCCLLDHLKDTSFDFTTRDFRGRTAVLQFFANKPKIYEHHFLYLHYILQITGHELAMVDSGCESLLTYHLNRNHVPSTPSTSKDLQAFFSSIPFSPYHDPNFCELLKKAYSNSKNWWRYTCWVAECNRSTWVDRLGDTPIIALVKSWDHSKHDERDISSIIKELVSLGAEIHMRDQRRETSLCIAVARGLRPAVVTLLSLGASPYSRRYDGKTILEIANSRLRRAKRDGNDKLYAMILSCVTLLADDIASRSPSTEPARDEE